MRRFCPIWICLVFVLLCAHAASAAEGDAAGPDAIAASQPTMDGAAPDAPADLAPAGESVADALERAAEALAEAEARSANADAAYSRMRRRNHPRGAAREQIVRERAEAQQALVAARAEYDALKGTPSRR